MDNDMVQLQKADHLSFFHLKYRRGARWQQENWEKKFHLGPAEAVICFIKSILAKQTHLIQVIYLVCFKYKTSNLRPGFGYYIENINHNHFYK